MHLASKPHAINMGITVYAFCSTRIFLTISWVCLLSIPTINTLNHSEYSVFFFSFWLLIFVGYCCLVIPSMLFPPSPCGGALFHTSLTYHHIPFLPCIFRHTLRSVLFSEKSMYMSFSIYDTLSSWPSINIPFSLCLKIKFWQSLGLYLPEYYSSL